MIVQAQIINVQMYTRCRGSTIQWCRCRFGGAVEVKRCRSQMWGSGVLIWRCCGYQNEVFVQAIMICAGAG